MPVYNGEEFIAQAIQSILDQDFRDFELIITDNASTDATADICQALASKDSRIRYHRNEQNIGATSNFNRCFELSSGGEYFKWCAADDCISPNYLSACIKAFEANPDAMLVYGSAQSIDPDGNEIPMPRPVMPEKKDRDPVKRYRSVINEVLACTEIFGLFRTEALGNSMLHESYYGSDRALVAEISLMGTLVHSPDAIFYNRDHPDRSINIEDKGSRAVWINPANGARRPLEHTRLLIQLVRVSVRHADVVPMYRTLLATFVWALKPLHLARSMLEIIGYLSPSLRGWLRRIGWAGVEALGIRRVFSHKTE